MNTFEQRLSEVCRQQTEAIVTRHAHELFKRLPMLSWLLAAARPEGGRAVGLYLAGLHRRPGSVRGSDAIAHRARRGASRGGAAHARAHLCTRGALMPATTCADCLSMKARSISAPVAPSRRARALSRCADQPPRGDR